MRILLGCLTAAALLVAAPAPAAADQVRFQLRDVRIETQREADGDRPYFTALAFRVRLCSPRTPPVVEVLEREPHDWVAYSEHNSGRVAGTHLFRGPTVPVPTWMGEYTFNNVTMLPFIRPNGNLVVLSDVEILGVAYFSFDNNNTPPHVIRGLMNDARGILQNVLFTELQQHRPPVDGQPRGCAAVLAGLNNRDPAVFSDNLQTELQEVAGRVIDGWRIAELLFQLTVGSTFNSDQPTGVNIVLVPTVTGLPEEFASGEAQQPIRYTLPTGSLEVQTTMLTPVTTTDRTLTFTGSGGVYRSRFALHVTASAPAQTATQVRLRIRTGGDDLRGGNDNVFAAVRVAGRWRPEVQLNRGGERWADNTTHDVMIPIGSTPVADIEAIRLRTTFGGGTGGDNWNMDSIQIDWRGLRGVGGALGTHGFKRFTGDERELTIEFE